MVVGSSRDETLRGVFGLNARRAPANKVRTVLPPERTRGPLSTKETLRAVPDQDIKSNFLRSAADGRSGFSAIKTMRNSGRRGAEQVWPRRDDWLADAKYNNLRRKRSAVANDDELETWQWGCLGGIAGVPAGLAGAKSFAASKPEEFSAFWARRELHLPSADGGRWRRKEM